MGGPLELARSPIRLVVLRVPEAANRPDKPRELINMSTGPGWPPRQALLRLIIAAKRESMSCAWSASNGNSIGPCELISRGSGSLGRRLEAACFANFDGNEELLGDTATKYLDRAFIPDCCPFRDGSSYFFSCGMSFAG